MDNMLEMYLYETNTLLEQLDELLIEAEKNEDGIFTSDGNCASYRRLVLLHS